MFYLPRVSVVRTPTTTAAATTCISSNARIIEIDAPGMETLGAVLTESLAPLGLSLRDYTVLIAAERAAIEGRPRTQLALAQAARLDKSTMVVALDALEEEGLVERRPDQKDRRARIVVPTDAGRELLARAEEVVLGVEGEVLADLDAGDRRALRDLLTRLVVG